MANIYHDNIQDRKGNRRSEKYNHLAAPVWDKYYYDNLRRLEGVDYAADSGFAFATDFSGTVIPNEREESIYQLSFLVSFAAKWLEDGVTNETTDYTDDTDFYLTQSARSVKFYPEQSRRAVVPKLLTLAEFGDSGNEARTETIYDDNGRLSAQIIYDANGNITLFALYLDDGGRVVIISTYDESGNLTSNICTTYDADGNVISREELPLPSETTTENNILLTPSVSSETSLEADFSILNSSFSIESMSSPSGPASRSQDFTYDNLGNRYQVVEDYSSLVITDTYTHNSINQYQTKASYNDWTGTDLYTLEYDDNGNLYDEGYGYIHTYDHRNRLLSISDRVNTVAEYTYDVLGRRIAKTVGDTTTYFYYDTDNRVIAQYTQEQSEDVQPDRTFVYGNGFSEILAMFLYEKPYSQDDVYLLFGFFDCWLTSTGNPDYNDDYDYINDGKIDLKDWAVLANYSWNLPDPASYETRYYYLMDALGSVRGLIGGRLNQESDREFYSYDVYGAPSDSSAAGNPFMFAGYWYDSESNLCNLVNRLYDPYTGRLLQLDPRGVNPSGSEQNPFKPFNQYEDGMNLYEYVHSNPILFVDPFGLRRYEIACSPIKEGSELWRPVLRKINILHCELHDEGLAAPRDIIYPVRRMLSGHLKYGSNAGIECKCAKREDIADCVRTVKMEYKWGSYYPNCHTQTKAILKYCCLTSNWNAPIVAGYVPDVLVKVRKCNECQK